MNTEPIESRLDRIETLLSTLIEKEKPKELYNQALRCFFLQLCQIC